MFDVRTRAAWIAVPLVLGCLGTGAVAGPGVGPPAGPVAPARGSGGPVAGRAAAPFAAPPVDPVAVPRDVLAVTVSPVLVPPVAPVDVTVRSPLLGGGEVTLEVDAGRGWAEAGRVRLDSAGTGRARLSRTAAATYRVRAVFSAAPVAAGPGGAATPVAAPVAAAASEPAAFEVTARGRGDARAYRYMLVRRGVPARWNPCAEVTYRVNARRARPTALADLREALRRVTYETGVRFREVGTTAQVPGAKGFRYDADLVVAWSDARTSRHLGGPRAASGGFEYPVEGRGGRPRIRHGFVVVDATVVTKYEPGFGAGVTEGEVLLHELGHVMGLEHADSEYQMMRPALHTLDAALYGAGDLTGLRRIGRAAGCV